MATQAMTDKERLKTGAWREHTFGDRSAGASASAISLEPSRPVHGRGRGVALVRPPWETEEERPPDMPLFAMPPAGLPPQVPGQTALETGSIRPRLARSPKSLIL